LYFTRRARSGNELYRSDGTAAGYGPWSADLAPGAASATPFFLTQVGNVL
jgi:ELWxxDGT repeat protein